MCRDFAVLAGLYFVYPNAEAYGLPGLFLWWNLAGACLSVGKEIGIRVCVIG